MLSPISRGLLPSSNLSIYNSSTNNFFEKAPPIEDSSLAAVSNSGGKAERGKSIEDYLKKRSHSSSLSSLTRYSNNENPESQFQRALREKALFKIKITKIAKMGSNTDKYSLVGMVAEGRPLGIK